MTLGTTVYEHYTPAGKGAGILPLVTGCRVLEIGFGSGALLKELVARGNEVYGVDAGQDIIESAKQQGFANVFRVDVSEEPLPFEADSFDAVYCYEVLEHLTNPHRLFTEIRRVLKRGRCLFFSVPAQEVDMGYGVLRHTFVYPGLLEKHNLERFLMQMYFRIEEAVEPGPTQWMLGRNYILVNMKDDRKPDVVEVIIKDLSVYELYTDVLTPESLRREVDTELEHYARILAYCAKINNMSTYKGVLSFVVEAYPKEYAFHLAFARRMIDEGAFIAAKNVLASLFAQADLPASVKDEIKTLLETIVANMKAKAE